MDKSLPADLYAEQAALGSILMERDAIIGVAPWLFADYFYAAKHATIYGAMLACYNRRVPPDLVNVVDELRRAGDLDKIGGAPYLIELTNSVPTALHVEYYGKIVERAATHRRLIAAGGKIAAIGFDEDEPDIDATLDRAEGELAAVRRSRSKNVFKSAAQVVDVLYERTSEEDQAARKDAIRSTGFTDLDTLLRGLYGGDTTILGAPSGCGKTALMLCIADHVARLDQHVAIASLEMPAEQLFARLAAIRCGVNIQDALDGTVPHDLLEVYTSALGELAALPITTMDEGDLSIMQLRANLRYLHTINPIRLVMVDYLQLVKGEGHNREQEVASVSRGLKALAKELRVPVFALSQLNDDGQVRDSRTIFHDASQVLILSREELIDPDTDKKGIAEIHVTKNRNGPTGVVPLRFFRSTTRFANLELYRAPVGY
jgi:replicative DNA helicase